MGIQGEYSLVWAFHIRSLCNVPSKTTRTYYKDNEAMKVVGQKIREIRNLKQISIEQLANECEVDATQIGRMELGKVNFSISYLYRIAKALEIHPKELIP